MTGSPRRLMGRGAAGRAVRSLRASTPAYDVQRGLARFSAALAASAVAAEAAQASAASSGATASSASAAATAGATSAVATAPAAAATTGAALLPGAAVQQAVVAATWVKLAAISTLFVGSIGTAVLVSSADAPPERGAQVAAPSVVEPAGAAKQAVGAAKEQRVASADEGDIAPTPAASSPASGSAPSASAPAPRSGPAPGDVKAPAAARSGSAVEAGADPARSASSMASASSPSADSVKAEMEHFAALRRTSDPQAALALAEQGHAKFPRGVFWQEREAIAIASLARVGRTAEARSRARAFIAVHPESLHASSMRELAGE